MSERKIKYANHLEIASFGGMLNNRTIKGWVELLNDFYWHQKKINGNTQEKYIQMDIK